MKLWNELTEEEQKAVIKLAEDIYKILNETIIEPLTKLFDELCWFFMAAEGIIGEDQEEHVAHNLELSEPHNK